MLANRRLVTASLISMLGLLSAVGFSASRDSSPACRGPDSFSNGQIAHLRGLMHSANPLDSAFLRAVHLPRVADADVQLVTADSVCVRAVSAWTAIDTLTKPALTSLYVIQVGSVYDAIDRQHSGGEWSQHLVLDSAFSPLGPYLY